MNYIKLAMFDKGLRGDNELHGTLQLGTLRQFWFSIDSKLEEIRQVIFKFNISRSKQNQKLVSKLPAQKRS